MYTVIKRFVDLQDNNKVYEVGDQFPRKGKAVSDSRLKELSSSSNRQGQPLIKLVEEPKDEPVEEKPKKVVKKKKAKE